MTLEPPPDDIAFETITYRRALGAFATGVCVVTADTANGPLGITINSFTSVSLEPRLVLWCLDESSERWAAFAPVERYAIHVLPADDEALARRFAQGVCTLSADEFTRDGDGAPRLPEALARFHCVAHARHSMGDHMVIVGRVDSFDAVAGDALTYFRGRYGLAGDPDA